MRDSAGFGRPGAWSVSQAPRDKGARPLVPRGCPV